MADFILELVLADIKRDLKAVRSHLLLLLCLLPVASQAEAELIAAKVAELVQLELELSLALVEVKRLLCCTP